METEATKKLTLEKYLDTFGEPMASTARIMLQLIRSNPEYLARTQKTVGEVDGI